MTGWKLTEVYVSGNVCKVSQSILVADESITQSENDKAFLIFCFGL